MMESIIVHEEYAFVFIFNLILSILVGCIIGFERESKGKDAGISTHTLVVLGSMLFTFLSFHVPESDSSTRIASQIVTGIGFLGAGLILKDGTTVRNLTTAASLWFSAAIGMAIGFQYYIVAILSTCVAVFILRIPHIPSQGMHTTAHTPQNSKVRE
jgi:putative Mg2+ transporter-C (MgtC) family protein